MELAAALARQPQAGAGTVRPPAIVVEYMGQGSLKGALARKADIVQGALIRVLIAMDAAKVCCCSAYGAALYSQACNNCIVQTSETGEASQHLLQACPVTYSVAIGCFLHARNGFARARDVFPYQCC